MQNYFWITFQSNRSGTDVIHEVSKVFKAILPIHFKKGKIQCIPCVIKFVKFDWLTALCYSQSCKNLLTRNFILFQWMCMVNFQLDYGLVKLQTLLTSVTACCVNKFWFLKNALQCAEIRFCETLFDANYFYLTLKIKHTIGFSKVVRRYIRKEEKITDSVSNLPFSMVKVVIFCRVIRFVT